MSQKSFYEILKAQRKHYKERLILFWKSFFFLACFCLTAHAEEGKIEESIEDQAPRVSVVSLHVQEDTPLLGNKRDLLKIELSWKRLVRWITVDTLLQKGLYALTLRKHHFEKDSSEKKPVFLHGGSFPLVHKDTRRTILAIDGFRQGAEFALFRTLHGVLLTLAGYELYKYATQVPRLPCYKEYPAQNLFLDFILDNQSLTGFFHALIGHESRGFKAFRYLPLLIPTWGGVKAGWNMRKGHLSHEEIQKLLEEVEGIPSTYWMDYGRWMFPLHPLDRRLNILVKNYLWNGDLKAEDLESIYNMLETIIRRHDGYTPVNAMERIRSIAYGLHAKDMPKKRMYSPIEASIEMRLILKDRAFAFLKKRAEGRGTSFMEKLYSHYLLWSFGERGIKRDLFFYTLKGGKLAYEIILLQNIIDAFLKVEDCPEQLGVTLAGVEPWANDLTQECFYAAVKLFNRIPGQPTSTLVGNLDQYHFPNCTVDLDLSNRGLPWQTVYNITKALYDHHINITSLNVSYNQISSLDEISSTLMETEVLDLSHQGILQNYNPLICQSNCLMNVSFSLLPRTLKFLNASWNMISCGQLDLYGNCMGATFSFNGMPSTLKTLDLSHNQIGCGQLSPYGTCIAGSVVNFSGLPFFLRTVDLSKNMMGFDGFVVNFTGLPPLLEGLNLSQNYIRQSSTIDFDVFPGTLTNLDLSQNNVGYNYTEFNFSWVPSSLKTLNLSQNYIGYDGAPVNFTGLPSSLVTLDLSENHIGGTGGLFNFIGLSPSLVVLDLSGNQIGFNETYFNFSGLPLSLETLDLSGNTIGCKSWNEGRGCTEKILVSFSGLSPTLKTLDLSGTGIGWNTSFFNFTNLPSSLETLRLSGNDIGCKQFDESGCIGGISVVFSGLPLFLSFLDLSINYIGLNASVIFKDDLFFLNTLDLSGNQIGCGQLDSNGNYIYGIPANFSNLPRSLSNLYLTGNCIGLNISDFIGLPSSLESLDLSNNWIGCGKISFIYIPTDDYRREIDVSYCSLGQSFNFSGSFPFLSTLRVDGNWIGFSGAPVYFSGFFPLLIALDLSEGVLGCSSVSLVKNGAVGGCNIGASVKLFKLPHLLTTLDLSHNWIGYSDGSLVDFTGLPLTLKALDLSYNYIGCADFSTFSGCLAGASFNFTGFPSSLIELDLSNNVIGFGKPDYCAFNFMTSLPFLQTLNLGSNYIGYYQVDISCFSNLNRFVPFLDDLDLSNNWIGLGPVSINFSGFPQSIKTLDLSNNWIGCFQIMNSEERVCEVGQAVNFIGIPSLLETLDLTGNFIGSGQNFINFTGLPFSLSTLKLSDNSIGCSEIIGQTCIGNTGNFVGLPSFLATLDLSENEIGFNNQFVNFSGLPLFLKILVLSGNQIGIADAVDFSGLPSSLMTVDLSKNAIGYNGTTINISSLPSSLAILRLRDNWIGSSTDAILSLSKSILELKNLSSIDLSDQQDALIGSTGPEGPTALFNALEALPHFDFDNFIGLSEIANISWGNGSTASILQKARFSSLTRACQHSMCYGGNIPNTPSGSSFRSIASTGSIVSSEAASLLLPPASFAELASNTTMSHESRALVVYEEPVVQPSILTDLGTSMVTGAALAVLPEALGDSLYLSGRMSEQNVTRLKLATNAALVFATGSWMGVGASWLTTKGLQYAGVTEPTARIAGNTTAFLVNSAKNFTPLGLTATALHYGAGYLGLLAEKKAMRWMFNKS